MIFVVRVSTNKEDQAIELIAENAKTKKLQVFSVVRPHGLRGYVIIEVEDLKNAEKACYNVPYVKGVIPKPLDYSEIKNIIEPTPEQIDIQEGDIVEIITDPFKKDKAKVVRLDKQKGDAVVELLETAVPIP